MHINIRAQVQCVHRIDLPHQQPAAGAALTHFSQRKLENTAWLNSCWAASLYPPVSTPPQTHTHTHKHAHIDTNTHTSQLFHLQWLRHNRKWTDFPEESAVRAATANTATTDKMYLIHRLYNGVPCQPFKNLREITQLLATFGLSVLSCSVTASLDGKLNIWLTSVNLGNS